MILDLQLEIVKPEVAPTLAQNRDGDLLFFVQQPLVRDRDQRPAIDELQLQRGVSGEQITIGQHG